MFRRLDSGLPKDPVFPSTLEGLGYFINEQDEIRSIENPKAYFKFFLSKNDRHNIVQREAMNGISSLPYIYQLLSEVTFSRCYQRHHFNTY